MTNIKRNQTNETKLPKVSIVTVCYNAATTIEDTIQSVINQTYPNIEYIIVDGNSTDRTIEIIEKYRKYVSKFISEPDKNLYDAINKGINLSSGEIIGTVNADDFLEGDAIETIVNSYVNNIGKDIYYGHLRMIDPKNLFSYIRRTAKNIDKKNMYKGMIFSHRATYITKKCYEDVGLYDTSFFISSDYDMVLRCINKKKQFVYVDKVLCNARTGGISSKEYLKALFEQKKIKQNHGCSFLLANYYFIRPFITSTIFLSFKKYSFFRRLYLFYRKSA